MDMDDLTNDKVAQFGAGMASTAAVGKVAGAAAIGKTALFTKVVGATAGTKVGAGVAAALLNPVTAPWLIVGGIAIIGVAALNKKKKWWRSF